jgi:hypothetical protein
MKLLYGNHYPFKIKLNEKSYYNGSFTYVIMIPISFNMLSKLHNLRSVPAILVGLTVVLVEEQQEESKVSLHCAADLSVPLEHDETQCKRI